MVVPVGWESGSSTPSWRRWREAFPDADDMPSDGDVLQVLNGKPMQLLGEGYHVIALVEPVRRHRRYTRHFSGFSRTTSRAGLSLRRPR